MSRSRGARRIGKKDETDSGGATLNSFRRNIRARAGEPPPGYLVQVEFDGGDGAWETRPHRWVATYKRVRGKPMAFASFKSRGVDLESSVRACKKAVNACVKRKREKAAAGEVDHFDEPPIWLVEDNEYNPKAWTVDGIWMTIGDAHRLYAKNQVDQGLDFVPLQSFSRDIYRDSVRKKKDSRGRCLVHIDSLNRYLYTKGRDGENVLVIPVEDDGGDPNVDLRESLEQCLEFVDMIRTNVPRGMNNLAEVEALDLASKTAHRLLGTKFNREDLPFYREMMDRLYGNTT